MKKKTYQSPVLQIVKLGNVLPVASSAINLNPEGEGDGGDATKSSGSYGVWDDED